MAEEFGTRDVFEQVDARLGNLEQDLREMRTETRFEFASVRTEITSQGWWLVGLILASWLTLMASIWLKQ